MDACEWNRECECRFVWMRVASELVIFFPSITLTETVAKRQTVNFRYLLGRRSLLVACVLVEILIPATTTTTKRLLKEKENNKIEMISGRFSRDHLMNCPHIEPEGSMSIMPSKKANIFSTLLWHMMRTNTPRWKNKLRNIKRRSQKMSFVINKKVNDSNEMDNIRDGEIST